MNSETQTQDTQDDLEARYINACSEAERLAEINAELLEALEGLLDFANAVTSEPRPGAVQRAAAVLRGERNA